MESADQMVDILQKQDAALGFRKSPFLLSYCAYIAATVLVRMAAQSGPGSASMQRLDFCLGMFQETEMVNTGVSRAKQVILSLMQRLNVTLRGGPDAADFAGAVSSHFLASGGNVEHSNALNQPAPFDMDALFATFAPLSDNGESGVPMSSSNYTWQAFNGLDSGLEGQDVLFGLMSGGNLSREGLFH